MGADDSSSRASGWDAATVSDSARNQLGLGALGRYRLLARIGAGGMGEVYRAELDGPGGFSRAVVIKRVKPELADDQAFIGALVDEAKLAARLHHPGIVQVLELGREGREHFLVMEHVDGHDLAAVLRAIRRPLSVGHACFIARELAGALAYLHTLADGNGRPLEIVHRDISLANVMLARTGAVKLLDFGVAKAASHVRSERTATGMLKGKVSYMSPEQADGLPVDARSDIFSLGVVLHECLTGERLFRAQDDLATLRMVRLAEVQPPSEVNPEVPASLDAIVQRMLARSPADRFQGGEEVYAALAPYVHAARVDPADLGHFVSRAVLVDEPPVERPATEITGAPSSSDRRPATASLATRAPARLGSWSIVAGAVAALGLALGLHAGLRRRGSALPTPGRSPAPTAPAGRDPAELPTPAAPPASAAPAPRAAPAKVLFRVTGPPGAMVTLDGDRLGSAPLERELPAVARERKVVIRHAGALPHTQTIAGDQAVTLDPSLRRARPAPKRPERLIRNPFD